MTRFEVLQVVAFAPNLLWFIAAWLVGNKRAIGWAFYLASEGGWIALAFVAHLWSVLPWCAVAIVLYARNFVRWKK